MASICAWIGHLLVRYSVMLEKLPASERLDPLAVPDV